MIALWCAKERTMDNSDMTANEISMATGNDQPIKAEKKRSSFKERWKNVEYRRKFLHSLAICGSFFALGVNAGQIGPTLLDLQIVTDTDLEKASAFFTSGSFGYLCGAVLCGIVYNKVNKDLLMFFSVLIQGSSACLTPFCSYYELMIFIRFLASFAGGFIDTCGNALLIKLWGTEGEGFMQFLHFCFAIGGVLSPLFSEPFLAPKTTELNSLVNTSAMNSTLDINSTSHFSTEPEETDVKYAFFITGFITITMSFPFLPFYNRNRNKEREKKTNEKRNQRKLPKKVMLVTLILICSFYLIYCCVEDTFASFLMTFVVKEYDSVSKSRGAFATAIYWASFASSRLLMVFLCRIFSSFQLLAMCVSLMTVSFTGFYVTAHFGLVNALIGFGAMSGLSMSAIFPAAFSWTEAELLKVTGVVAGSIQVFASISGMVNPLILGFLMEKVSNMWFCYLLLGESIGVGLVFVSLLILSRCYLSPKFGPCMDSEKDDLNIQESFLADTPQEVDEKGVVL